MTTPIPTPSPTPSATPDPSTPQTPASGTDTSAAGSTRTSSGQDSAGSTQSVAPFSSTAAAAPGPLAPDALAAMQSALAAEQAAVWAYGLVAAHARDDAAMIAENRSGHLLRRDATAARLVASGAEAAPPAPAYQVSVNVVDVPSARQLAQDIEADAAAAWRVVIGSTDDPELRGFALTGLSDAAVRLAMWKRVAGATPTTVPFAGQG